MYGLINRAVQDLVTTKFGAQKWEEIKEKSEINVPVFVGMNTYPDEITYKLVAAASSVLGLTQTQVLEAFGEYWILYTAKEGYGQLLSMSGNSFVEFLQNMNNLHARVQLSFPKLKAPSFECSDITAESMRLRYYTERPGLAPLVVGLLRGLGKKFATAVEIVHDKPRGGDRDFDEFLIRFTGPTSSVP